MDEFDSTQNIEVFNRTLIWTRGLTQGRTWFNYKANINSKKAWRITFEGLSGKTVWSDLALDDFSIAVGKCPPTKTCDFEAGNYFINSI